MLADLLARAGLLLDNRVTQLLREIADHPNDVNLYEAAARAFNIRAMHELAAAAELVHGKLARVPVAIIRGVEYQRVDDASTAELIRPAEKDMVR